MWCNWTPGIYGSVEWCAMSAVSVFGKWLCPWVGKALSPRVPLYEYARVCACMACVQILLLTYGKPLINHTIIHAYIAKHDILFSAPLSPLPSLLLSADCRHTTASARGWGGRGWTGATGSSLLLFTGPPCHLPHHSGQSLLVSGSGPILYLVRWPNIKTVRVIGYLDKCTKSSSCITPASNKSPHHLFCVASSLRWSHMEIERLCMRFVYPHHKCTPDTCM